MISDIEFQSQLGKVDHCVIRFDFKCYTQLRYTTRKVQSFNKAHKDAINSEIKAIDWSNFIKEQHDINDA
jgi:hypothetical protein